MGGFAHQLAQLAPLLRGEVRRDIQLRLREHLPDAGAVVVLVHRNVVVPAPIEHSNIQRPIINRLIVSGHDPTTCANVFRSLT